MAGVDQAIKNAAEAAKAAPTTGGGVDLWWKIPVGVAVGVGSLVMGQTIEDETLQDHYDFII